MKRIFASICLLAFTFLTFNITPAFSAEIIEENVTYNPTPGVNYSTTKVTTTPDKTSTLEKVGGILALTALVGGAIVLAAVAAHDDRPPEPEFHHNPPPHHYAAHHGPHHAPRHNMHR